MKPLVLVPAALVALLHLGFFVLESILWKTPFGRRTFGLSASDAEVTATLALNQGIYNLLLAAGIAFSLVRADRGALGFCLGCVVVAGIAGGATASPAILLLQALPGAVALALLWV